MPVTTFAELFGATFPAETDVRVDVEYTDGVTDYEGSLAENFGMDPDKNVIRMKRGDSYDGTANAVKSFVVTKNFAGWTGTLTVRHRVTAASLSSVSVTVASATLLTASFAATDTAFAGLTTDDDFGPHPFDIQMVSGASKQTPIEGVVIISKDMTLT
jgi:hypothetical protein